MINFTLVANRKQQGEPEKVEEQAEDADGNGTMESLRRSLRLARRITGNDGGSLGLHPAVFFCGPSGVRSNPMFMGTVALIGKRLANNDPTFFDKFTAVPGAFEAELIAEKDILANILQEDAQPNSAGTDKHLLR